MEGSATQLATAGEAPAAATKLTATVGCDPATPGRPTGELTWAIAKPRGQAQRVEMTILPDGFEKGEFESSRELPPDQSSLSWQQFRGQATHYWRVSTKQGGEWVPSEVKKFQGPLCIADGID
jgi:hypothetical protein